MILNRLTACAMVLAASVVTASASDTQALLRQMGDEAKSARTEAREISRMLSAKTPDLDAVRSKLETLRLHSATLREHVRAFDAANPVLGPKQTAQWQRVQVVSEVLEIFVNNKTEILAGEDVRRNRGLLRAKADGIAQRAGMVESAVSQMSE